MARQNHNPLDKTAATKNYIVYITQEKPTSVEIHGKQGYFQDFYMKESGRNFVQGCSFVWLWIVQLGIIHCNIFKHRPRVRLNFYFDDFSLTSYLGHF